MSEVQQTAQEVMESLTGFDEMAIAKHFGRPLSVLTADESMLGRALVFVLKRRDGANDDEARNAALEMPLKAITSAFADDEDEESGKDEPASEPPRVISLPGVSEPVAVSAST